VISLFHTAGREKNYKNPLFFPGNGPHPEEETAGYCLRTNQRSFSGGREAIQRQASSFSSLCGNGQKDCYENKGADSPRVKTKILPKMQSLSSSWSELPGKKPKREDGLYLLEL